jgi:hypothetical protein
MSHTPFGTFNPRFYGVSMFLGDTEKHDVLERYGETTPRLWSKEAATTSSLKDICTLSAMDHEVRHFHDFLLTPLGTITMGLRMQASINGIQAMKAFRRCRGSFIPVPLIRWIGWDSPARQRWIDTDGRFFGISRLDDIVNVPCAPQIAHYKAQPGTHPVSDSLTPEEQLSAYALFAAQAYNSLTTQRLHRVSQFDIDVSADDVFEGPAHLIQLQAIWTGQGDAPAKAFLEFIRTSSAANLRALQLLWEALQRSSPAVNLQRFTELFTWMLLGRWEDLSSGGHPANRYFQLLALAALSPNHDIFVGPMPSAELFDQLDELTESSGWRANLASASAAADRRNSSYLSLAKTLHGGYFDAVFALSSLWHDNQRSVRQTFLNDPESLVGPLRYLTEDRFPRPFLETRLGSMVHHRDEPLTSKNHRAIAADSEGKQVLSYISKLDAGQTTADLDHVLSARILTHMVDFLFADEPVFDLYEYWCRSQIQGLSGKRIVSVY